MLDPATIILDPTRLATAVAQLNEQLTNALSPDPEQQYEVDDFPSPTSLQDLIDVYDYGEPLWNGSLMYLTKALLVEPPTTVEIESLDDLGKTDINEVQRFHHGNVVCKGDLGIHESTWITGNLHVTGAISASHLDAFSDLLVGGNVKCRAIEMMGLTFIAGTLDARDIAYIWVQGETWVLGGVRGGALVGEHGSVEEMDSSQVEQHFDVEDLDIETVAAKLGDVVRDDDSVYDVVARVLYRQPSA